MSHTQDDVKGAISRSTSHDEIVTVRVGSEESIQEVYDALIAESTTDHAAYVDVSGTFREVWGWNEDSPDGDMVWRVHIMQDERVGTDRFRG